MKLSALDNQIQYYDGILKQHPDWILYDRYIDEGISGTSTKKKKNFVRMLEDAAILLQNAFPTLEKYIDHVHTVDGVPLNVPTDLQNEIKSLFKNMLGLKKRGTNLFFTDIDSLKKMLDEIE